MSGSDRPSSRTASTLTRKYTCMECGLLFLHEESTIGRYIRTRRQCARCIVEALQKKGELSLPECYGKQYSGSDEICTRYCKVSQACLVACCDDTALQMVLESEQEGRTWSGNLTYATTLRRLLRAIGKPIHVRDLGPLINKFTEGRFTLKKQWWLKLRVIIYKTSGVVDLGAGFCCWVGVWDGEVGVCQQTPRDKVTPVRKIVEALEEEHQNKREDGE